ncbi:MAG: fimbrial protein FimV, partial [Thiomonas sp.]|nr:fimbrial protein FimV [Thiomonas sp.]
MLRLNTRRLALAIALGATAGQAYAFGLGGIKVQSALGQPLRAEIDITQLSADEASSLKVGVAPPDAFQAAKLQYSSALSGIRIKLERNPDGRAYLRVTSSSPINEPFLDLLIRAQWSSGQISRDYTLLLDPPNFQPAPSVAQVPVQAPPSVQTPAQTPSSAPPVAAAPAMPAAPALQTPVTSAAKPKPMGKTAAAEGQYVVKRGDTLGKIAAASGVETVSLDQMLTAIYRANQSAFIDGNINLLKAGAVLQMPSAEQAQGIPQQEARRFVVTQSENFNAYRQRLAAMSGQAKPQAQQSQREATGKVQAQVQEPVSTGAQAESKLKLSKAEVGAQGAANKAQHIADQKQAALDEQKIKQLQKNVDELSALSKQAQTVAAVKPQTAAPTVAAVASKAAAVTVPVASPVPASAAKPAVAPSAPAAVAAASAAAASEPHASSVAASVASSAPAAAPVVKPAAPKVSKPAPVEQESFFSSLLSNPLLLPAGGGLVVLLLLLAWLAQRKKASKSQRDVSVFDSRMSVADSFFGGTGGERVDTRNGNMSSTFSSSQLDTNDVDPVAEADVYLAYGRDLQAEEILKEAVKANPDRLAARLK